MRKGESYKGKTILAVGAHPDDIDFAAGGTIAKMIKDGAEAYLLILTNGNKGADDPKITKEKLAEIRKMEQVKAARLLGIKDVFFLNHEDSELIADHNLKEEIVTYIRKLKPDIVFCWDPSAYYSEKRGFITHTDHRAAGEATLDAVFPLSRDRLTFGHLEQLGLKPHKVKTVYMINMDSCNCYFDISKTLNQKIKCVRIHKSQVGESHVKMIKSWAEDRGKESGFKFAEGFKMLEISD